MIRIITLLLGVCCLLSCDEDVQEIRLTVVNTQTSQDLCSIDVLDDEIIVVGGEVFQQGVTLIGSGQSWITDNGFSNKRLFDVDCTDSRCVAVGQDGFYYTYTAENGWMFTRLDEWDFQRAVSITQSHTVTVSGKSFALGRIYHINSENQVDTVHVVGNQMQDVTAVDDQTFVAVGYGTIMRSTDGGYDWTYLDQEGDFYQSVDFWNHTNGIIVGLSGSILLTDDGGLTWNTVKSPSTLTGGGRDHFIKVKYINATEIYIVGDAGLIWHSTDGGNSWDAMQADVEINFNDIAVYENQLYIVGNDGYMGVLEL